MKGRKFTNMEEAIIKDMFHRGASAKDIAKRINRTESAIRARLSMMGLKCSERDAKHESEPVKQETPAPEPITVEVKEKTLDDFKPSEIFKHLDKLGYRFGDVYCIKAIKVNIQDLIARP